MKSLPPITGTADIMLQPAVVVSPGPPHTYLGMARAFLIGSQTLAASSISAISLSFLCAQAAECGLKAYLSRTGDDKRLTKNHNLRHDLVALWNLASSEGLSIASTPPSWLVTLGHLHRSPYYLRYSTGVNGLVTPPAQPMTTELAALIDQVSQQL
jgi:hypothetical protein